MSACEKDESGKLDNRVVDFWNFKIDRNFAEAYDFLSPGWKSNENQESFIRRMSISAVKWTSVKLLSKKCRQKDLCVIKVEIGYEYQFRGAVSEKMQVETTLAENWIMKDNIWYNIPIKKKIGK